MRWMRFGERSACGWMNIWRGARRAGWSWNSCAPIRRCWRCRRPGQGLRSGRGRDCWMRWRGSLAYRGLWRLLRGALLWWGVLGWAATVAVVVFAVSLWRENSLLKGNFGVGEFASGEERARHRRVAENRSADPGAGCGAGDAGRSEDSSAAAEQGVLSEEAQQSGFAGE